MTLLEQLSFVTWVGQLGLAVLCVARSRRSMLALPLGALCFVMFGWNFAEWAYRISHIRAWGVLDLSIAPLTMPVAFYFILAFIGARRRLRSLLVFVSLTFGGLSLACASAFFSEAGRRFVDSALRGWIEGTLIVSAVAVAFVCLVAHERSLLDSNERIRTRLVIAALLVGAALGVADVLDAFRLPVPSMLVTTCLLALVVLRFEAFERAPSSLGVVYAMTVSVLGVIGYVVAFRVFAARHAVLGFTLVVVTVVLAVATRQVLAATSTERARMERLAVLGRMAAQMAHDLKNPLASLKGAAQFLKEERARGRSIDDQQAFLDLIVAESERLASLIERYQRLGTLELHRSTVDVNALIHSVVGLRHGTLPKGASIDLALATDLPTCEADADLLAAAVENLVTNAIEASTENGRVVLRTALSGEDSESLVISVEDNGCGMNVRERERVWDEFFTTKAHGSGLGLPFVKRVVEAHDGRLTLRTREREGTEIRLYVPLV